MWLIYIFVPVPFQVSDFQRHLSSFPYLFCDLGVRWLFVLVIFLELLNIIVYYFMSYLQYHVLTIWCSSIGSDIYKFRCNTYIIVSRSASTSMLDKPLNGVQRLSIFLTNVLGINAILLLLCMCVCFVFCDKGSSFYLKYF